MGHQGLCSWQFSPYEYHWERLQRSEHCLPSFQPQLLFLVRIFDSPFFSFTLWNNNILLWIFSLYSLLYTRSTLHTIKKNRLYKKKTNNILFRYISLHIKNFFPFAFFSRSASQKSKRSIPFIRLYAIFHNSKRSKDEYLDWLTATPYPFHW